MNNYAYIINECKKAFYGKWEELAIKACISRLPSLSHEELVNLMSCRWLKKNDEVRKEVVKVLFKEQLEQHEQLIATSTIDELGAMLIEKGGNNVKWARMELKRRYQDASHEEQMRIISYFKKGTTKQDVKWGETREKKL
jgi:hypothetical protein